MQLDKLNFLYFVEMFATLKNNPKLSHAETLLDGALSRLDDSNVFIDMI